MVYTILTIVAFGVCVLVEGAPTKHQRKRRYVGRAHDYFGTAHTPNNYSDHTNRRSTIDMDDVKHILPTVKKLAKQQGGDANKPKVSAGDRVSYSVIPNRGFERLFESKQKENTRSHLLKQKLKILLQIQEQISEYLKDIEQELYKGL